MKIFSWNIREGRAVKKRGLIRTTLRKEKPDIVVLLEVKKERLTICLLEVCGKQDLLCGYFYHQ